MSRPRLLLIPPALAVALILAAAPFVSWRQADPEAPADATVSAGLELPETVTFNAHVRPILVAKCFRCHGSDPGSREAELRLDRPEFAFAPRTNGRPVRSVYSVIWLSKFEGPAPRCSVT